MTPRSLLRNWIQYQEKYSLTGAGLGPVMHLQIPATNIQLNDYITVSITIQIFELMGSIYFFQFVFLGCGRHWWPHSGIPWWPACAWSPPHPWAGPCQWLSWTTKHPRLWEGGCPCWFSGWFKGLSRCPDKSASSKDYCPLKKNLTEYDRKPIAFPSCHRTKLVQGRFKVAKKSTVIPGADSTKRCFLGQNSGPASWPDCNRYMESNLPFTSEKNGNTTLCLTLVHNTYCKIREAVLNNSQVMEQTGIQLAEVNQRTMIQW